MLRASDDPAAAAAAERALSTLSRSDAQQRALDASRAATQLAESSLGEAGALLQQARELLVGAGNGSYNDADRSSLGQVIAGLRGDLLALANRRDSDGRYIFGGQGSDGPPLQDGPGGVGFNGTPGQATTAAGRRRRCRWTAAPSGCGPTTRRCRGRRCRCSTSWTAWRAN